MEEYQRQWWKKYGKAWSVMFLFAGSLFVCIFAINPYARCLAIPAALFVIAIFAAIYKKMSRL